MMDFGVKMMDCNGQGRAHWYCELQYKCQFFSNFSIENAERVENFP